MKKKENTPRKGGKKPELIEIFEKMKKKKQEQNLEKKKKEISKIEEKETGRIENERKKVKDLKFLFERSNIDIRNPPDSKKDSAKKGRKKEKIERSIPADQKSIRLFFQQKKNDLADSTPGKRKFSQLEENTSNFEEISFHTPKKLILGEDKSNLRMENLRELARETS